MNSTTGERIAKARNDLGLSIEEVAGRAGVRAATVEKWEAGRVEPRPNKLLQLAGVLEVSLLWLMTGVAAEDEDRVVDFDPLARLDHKLERALALQAESSRVLSEIADELAGLRRRESGAA